MQINSLEQAEPEAKNLAPCNTLVQHMLQASMQPYHRAKVMQIILTLLYEVYHDLTGHCLLAASQNEPASALAEVNSWANSCATVHECLQLAP